ncbi:unnamed protein product [Larinioides sclopetarius]|uniref:Maturase K n=1 Tax=Larinioides sclopetarius TaxID=280406 RepID=A0AAV2BR28_9ARAC
MQTLIRNLVYLKLPSRKAEPDAIFSDKRNTVYTSLRETAFVYEHSSRILVPLLTKRVYIFPTLLDFHVDRLMFCCRDSNEEFHKASYLWSSFSSLEERHGYSKRIGQSSAKNLVSITYITKRNIS